MIAITLWISGSLKVERLENQMIWYSLRATKQDDIYRIAKNLLRLSIAEGMNLSFINNCII